MSISSSHQDLFHQPSAAEKISFVRSLMETGQLNADVALALLKSIHTELAQPQEKNHSLYASYARVMASLQHKMPDVHQHVVANWQATQRVEPEEASAEEGFIETETGAEMKRTETSNVEDVGQDKEFWETEGEAEGSESETEEERSEIEEKEEGEEQEEEKSEIEESEKEEPDKEEREDEEHEQEDEPEEENLEEVEDNVEESEIEQEELETKEEQGEEETGEEEKEAPEEAEAKGEESDKSEIETGGEAEGDEIAGEERMATEAAEAAAHMEHAENETELVEEEQEPEE